MGTRGLIRASQSARWPAVGRGRAKGHQLFGADLRSLAAFRIVLALVVGSSSCPSSGATRWCRATPIRSSGCSSSGRCSVRWAPTGRSTASCFGDSGGPIFIEDTNFILGVNSYVVHSNCKGTGGAFRIDQADVQEWILSFL